MKQQKWQEITFNACIVLNCLLLFLLIFGQQLQLPPFLQSFGRAHPLLLHFPIVLLLLAFVFEIYTSSAKQLHLTVIADWILLSAAFTTVLSALMGLFLSMEEGYQTNDIVLHKWLGVGCAVLSVLWFGLRSRLRKSKWVTGAIGSLTTVLLLAAGHNGANITHGENFLLSPVLGDDGQEAVSFEDAVVYTHLVKPILEEKCMGCHNSNKAKGELVMESEQLLLKGGKNGKLWDTTAAGFGLMMQRIHLPLENEEHMPPKGKAQLTPEEVRLLYLWIKGGASFTQKLADLPGNDSIRMIASTFLKKDTEEIFDFPAADGDVIAKLRTDYRVVMPYATGSPALSVTFFGASKFKAEQLKELEKIKNNIVSLHLAKMPVTDDELKMIGQFNNLRDLNLSFTKITGSGLQHLAGLKKLRQLSLSGTKIDEKHLKLLMPLEGLRSVQIWNTGISDEQLASVSGIFPKVRFNVGYKGDTVIAKLTPPIIKGDGDKTIFKSSLPVMIKNPINGAITRYTLDGSEPDSATSPVYKEAITISGSGMIKARSFLKGWVSSDLTTKYFYKNSIKPDSVQLINPPTGKYIGKGGHTLIDGVLSEPDLSTKDWLGFQEKPFEAFVFLRAPVEIESVTFSCLVNIRSHVFPAAELQVWGGAELKSLKLLNNIRPAQPDSIQPTYITGYNCHFARQKIGVIKLVARPVSRLPQWHPANGQKGWVFLDELFLN